MSKMVLTTQPSVLTQLPLLCCLLVTNEKTSLAAFNFEKKLALILLETTV
jgi:hypothetical protein